MAKAVLLLSLFAVGSALDSATLVNGVQDGIKKGQAELPTVHKEFSGRPDLEHDDGKARVDTGAHDLQKGVSGLMQTLEQTETLAKNIKQEIADAGKVAGANKDASAEASKAAKALKSMQQEAEQMSTVIQSGAKSETVGGFEVHDSTKQEVVHSKADMKKAWKEVMSTLPSLQKDLTSFHELMTNKYSADELTRDPVKLQAAVERVGAIESLIQSTDTLKSEAQSAGVIGLLAYTNPLLHLGILAESYVYCYPLVVMNETADRFPPKNTFVHEKKFGRPTTQVAAPNVDSVLSSAFIDLSDAPVILHVPAQRNAKSYYIAQVMDFYTNTIASIGTRTTGNGEGTFWIVPQGWKGSMSSDTDPRHTITSPTNWAWIIVRQVPIDDNDAINLLNKQEQFYFTTLGQYHDNGSRVRQNNGETSHSHPDKKGLPPTKWVAELSWAEFMSSCAHVIAQGNPLTPADPEKEVQLTMAGINIVNGTFSDPAGRAGALFGKVGALLGKATIYITFLLNPNRGNGWTWNKPNNGDFGKDYRTRAELALFGLGANLPKDECYAAHKLVTDSKVLRKLELPAAPPVRAFWSFTMYTKEMFVSSNKANKFAISNHNVVFNQDFSITMHFGNELAAEPGMKNYLPTPEKEWKLLFRGYWPMEAMLNREYQLPEITDADTGAAAKTEPR